MLTRRMIARCLESESRRNASLAVRTSPRTQAGSETVLSRDRPITAPILVRLVQDEHGEWHYRVG